MTDTHPAMEARFKRLIMARSRQERLIMGCSMFDAAKRIVRSSLVHKRPEISAREIKVGIFSRLYGGEFDEVQKGKIAEALREHD